MQRAAGRAAPCRSVCHYGQTYKVWLGRSVYPNTGPNICPIKPMQPICPIKPIQPISPFRPIRPICPIQPPQPIRSDQPDQPDPLDVPCR